MISVVIPYHNPGDFLAQAVENVLNSGIEGLELILVDDASDQKFECQGVRTICSPGLGPAGARNLGWRAASQPYLAFLDADDLWEAGGLRCLLECLKQNPQASVAQGKMRHQVLQTVAKDPLRRHESLPHYGINLGACLYRKELLERLGGFDESLRFGEDTDLFIRCWHLGVNKVRIPETTLVYRLHSANMTLKAPQHQALMNQLILRQVRRARAGFPQRTEPGLADYLGCAEPPAAIGEAYELCSQSV